MKNVTIDNLTLTEKMVEELTKWYSSTCDSYPEQFLIYIDQAKDTLIRLMCNDNSQFDDAIKESLAGIIQIQDSIRNLMPEKNNAS